MTLNPKEIGVLAGKLALHACGHSGPAATASPAVAGYAVAVATAVEASALAATAKTATDWTGADPRVIAAAICDLVAYGLIPGGPMATGYLYKEKSNLVGKPNPRGRREMARQAGVNVHTVAVGRKDRITLAEDGDLAVLTRDPDGVPTTWDDLRGVVVHIDDLGTGARRSAWVSLGEIKVRRDKSQNLTAWNAEPISMACSKAISILVTRGAIPQASLLPRLLGAFASTAPLTIDTHATTPRQIAEALPQPTPAPPTQADPEPEYDIDPDVDPAEGPADEATDPEPVPNYAAEVAALAADAECGLILAEQTITAAVAALREAGMARAPADLRAPAVWRRLILRASQDARAYEAEAHNA
jgi:hypothetical protein